MWPRSPWEGGRRLAPKTTRLHCHDRDHRKMGRGTEAEGDVAAPRWAAYAESGAPAPTPGAGLAPPWERRQGCQREGARTRGSST